MDFAWSYVASLKLSYSPKGGFEPGEVHVSVCIGSLRCDPYPPRPDCLMIIRDRKKLIVFDRDVLSALEAHSRQTGSSQRTLINEAVRDLLRKKAQPVGLKAALQQSARIPANEDKPSSKTEQKKRRR